MANYFTTEEAAAKLRVKPQTLRLWRLNGRGPRFSKPSRSRVLYPEAEIERFMAEKTFTSTAEESTRRGAAA